MKNLKSTPPPPRGVGGKLFFVLCVVVALALCLAGCGSGSYDDYLSYQQRYEKEKELVDYLREYDSMYAIYRTYDEAPYSIAFVLDHTGEVVLTHENIESVSIYRDGAGGSPIVFVQLDSAGAESFSAITAENIGRTLSIEKRRGIELVSTIISSTIGSQISGGTIMLDRYDELAATEIYNTLLAPSLSVHLSKMAAAYNTARGKYSAKVEYLPASLSTVAPFDDVSSYIEKATRKGF